MRRLGVVVACAPLVLLAGCPQNQAAAPGKMPAQAMAPALAPKPVAPAIEVAKAAPVAAPYAQTAATAQKTAKDQQLINEAEQAYQNGVNSYNAGRMDAARMYFDAAVDLMLSSGMDLKNDPQLSDEFENLLDKVNSLEMAALKQGNGFSPQLEAAPLDTADEVTFPPNAALTKKLETELKTTQSDFPLVVNDYVAGFINYFSNNPKGHAHLMASLARAGKYKEMISRDLREAGVPQDLMYLAVAESGFQPQALNRRSGAGGMWQFMPTGAYGLVRNGWFDERFDPEKSSKAYARYMKSLYDQFGDWYLAMAAYDWGPGYVQRAVMKTGYADFWELYRRGVLPAETKNYVPGIIAAIIMAKNPAQYGLDKVVSDPAVLSDTVTVDSAIDLRLVADVTGASLEEIVALNPSLLRMTTPSDMPFDLHIPVGTTATFESRMKEIPEDKRDTWRFHVVRDGETLASIATEFHSRTSEIAEENDIASGDPVDTGDELVIPVATASRTVRPEHYRTRRGDTLITVADRFGVSVEELRRWNHMRTNTVAAGRMLLVSEPVRLAPHGRVRRRTSGRRSSSHTRSSSVHAASGHTAKKKSSAKSSATKKKRTSKTKSKAGR
ncbi:lytic transglycosylase domain-containing protein [Edaphobacter sp.]|uniref:lytic transglycosylase domain-containing protein n=1 Tax=Edaphobacter sp. TaxID=1934404 RepID=UPI002DB7F21F|nr:transglycosylase SLT domain-containing protein [Edaphobacter sp.]HEU5340604.1 transglycosylase SLT domain-containing protein [Edaphobacter sp.]